MNKLMTLYENDVSYWRLHKEVKEEPRFILSVYRRRLLDVAHEHTSDVDSDED